MRTTRLQSLLAACGLPDPAPDAIVTGVAHDSRLVEPGQVFVAIRGFHVDGHDHVRDAVGRGAVAIIHQDPVPDLPVAAVQVPDTRAALAALAAEFWGRPSEQMLVVGITGTDGKTTTCALAGAALEAAGYRVGVMTTVMFKIRDQVRPNLTRQTTLEAPQIQAALAEMLAAGCEVAVLEVSSHALVLNRVDAVEFDVAAVTNVTHEHLDFHGTWEAYAAAKRDLVVRAGASLEKGKPKWAVLNAADASYSLMRTAEIERHLAYQVLEAPQGGSSAEDQGVGLGADLGLTAEGVRLSTAGSAFICCLGQHRVPVELQLPGSFNVENALCAMGVAVALGARLEHAAEGLGAVTSVPGRMERVEAGQPFAVVIDYAHTPVSLEKLLVELEPLTRGRLIAVFGAAGERDRAKRPVMGALAARRCQLVVLTEEDSRNEDQGAILDEIAMGAEGAGLVRGQNLLLVPDRTEAIAEALARAGAGDTVLLAGKGHESNILGPDGPRPWNEREVVLQALAELGYSADGS